MARAWAAGGEGLGGRRRGHGVASGDSTLELEKVWEKRKEKKKIKTK
jgi:hypothetical protein